MKNLGKLINVFGYVDYLVAAAVVGYGIYAQSWLYVAVGLVSFLLAWLAPAQWLKARLEAKILKKQRHDAGSVLFQDDEFVPAGVLAGPALYQPRSRYEHTAYFVKAAGRRWPMGNPRDLQQMLASPSKVDTHGVKPPSLGERQVR